MAARVEPKEVAKGLDGIVSFFERLPSKILLCFELRFLSDPEIVDLILGEAGKAR
jgi:hypothetical protein